MSIFNSLSGKVKEKKDQKLLEKREKYYRSEILPEIRKIVQGEFVTSKIGVVDRIDAKKCELDKEELIKICNDLVDGSIKLDRCLKPLDNELQIFLNKNELIQNAYIDFVLIKKKDRNEFYYNGDKYLIELFETIYDNQKEIPFSQKVSDYLNQRSVEQLVGDVNKEIANLKKAEELLLKIFLMPRTTLAYVCAVKHMEQLF